MSFRFSLAAVLHFRQSVEHQQELRLRAANQQVARVRHLIDQLEAHRQTLRLHQSQELGTGTTAAELRFAMECEAVVEQQEQVLQRELLRLEKQRDEQQKVFQQARRERETIESLRNRQLREYKHDRARREQRQLDDLFLLRQAYAKRG